MRTDHILGLNADSFHRVSYTDWGSAGNARIVICVHGLTRNCRDFDFLAQALADRFRVVCPDIVGRGRSDWLTRKADYGYPQYMADMTALLARVTCAAESSARVDRVGNSLTQRYGAASIYWVGTSMGGMLGMLLAAHANTPIRKLVVNDVGPLIPKAALERIAAYVGKNPRFKTFEELEAHVRQVSAPFGPLTDAHWRHLTLHGAKQHENGEWGMSYDPDIAAPFRAGLSHDIDLWDHWDRISCPTLALRGAMSDVLLKETAASMQTRGPHAQLVEFAGIGHAPTLMAEDQIQVVKDFLLAPD